MIDYVISIERGLAILISEQYGRYKNISEQQLNKIWDKLTERKAYITRNIWYYTVADYKLFKRYDAVTPYIENIYYKLKLKQDGNGGDIDDD